MYLLRAPTSRAACKRQSANQTNARSARQSNAGAVQVTGSHLYTPTQQEAGAQACRSSAREARAFLFAWVLEAVRDPATCTLRGARVLQRMSFDGAAGDAWRAV